LLTLESPTLLKGVKREFDIGLGDSREVRGAINERRGGRGTSKRKGQITMENSEKKERH